MMVSYLKTQSFSIFALFSCTDLKYMLFLKTTEFPRKPYFFGNIFTCLKGVDIHAGFVQTFC